MNKVTTSISPLTKRCWTAKKAIATIVTVLSTVTCMSMSVFAAGVVDTSNFISSACTVLKALLALIGAGLAIWGVVNLIEGYGNDNPGAKSQGMKQTMAGIAIIMVGVILVPVLQTMMTQATT